MGSGSSREEETRQDVDYKDISLDELPDESADQGRIAFYFSDLLLWRDVPDWYYRSISSTAFGMSYFTLRQYLNLHELEIFLPPRARMLPASMQYDYRMAQLMRAGLYKVSQQTAVVGATSAVFFAGAYYLGKLRGVHEWLNFSAAGVLAALPLAALKLQPFGLRQAALACCLGASAGLPFGLWQSTGQPLWDESHDFEGWWLGRYVNKKLQRESPIPA